MLAKRAPLPELPIADTRMLTAFLDSAATPPEHRRIHCAVECFPYRLSTLQPAGYDEAHGLVDFMTAMGAYGWQPLIEDNIMVGIKRGASSVKVREGARLRIACSEASTLHETAAAFDAAVTEMNQIGADLNLGFLSIGFHPTAQSDDIADPPGARFRVIEEALSERTDGALDSLRRSCGARVTLTYANEEDMVKKFRVTTALQPVVAALFASSPFAEGKITEYKSMRMNRRMKLISGNDNLLPRIFAKNFGFDSFAEWAIEQPMLYIKRNGQIINTEGYCFGDFIDGSKPELNEYQLTSTDWDQHLKQILSDITLAGGVTIQGADSGPSEMMLALVALWTGLLHEKTALDAAWTMVKHWKPKDIGRLRNTTPLMGLEAEIGNRKLIDIAREVMKIAMYGLLRRAKRLEGGADEGRYLQVLFDYVESHKTRADMLRMQQQFFPDFSLRSVFEVCRLQPPAAME